MNAPQLGVALEILVHAVQHLLALLVGELEAGDRERVLEHRARDARRALLLQLRPQHTRQERRRQAGGGEIRDELPSRRGRWLRHTRRDYRAERGKLGIGIGDSLDHDVTLRSCFFVTLRSRSRRATTDNTERTELLRLFAVPMKMADDRCQTLERAVTPFVQRRTQPK